MSLDVREITPAEHLSYVQGRDSVSFLQVPSWAAVKAEWGSLSIGWFRNDELVGAGLVLLRKIPRLPRYLAYLPEGPDIDWSGDQSAEALEEWLQPMLELLKSRGVFSVKMGPSVPVRRWQATTIKDAIAAGNSTRLREITPDWQDGGALATIESLKLLGWTQRPDTGAGFGDVQPRYVFQIPLAGRSEEDLLRGFNQLWRRNIKKADKAGVQVRRGGREALADFYPVYLETAERDGFLPRPQSYFERMWDAMAAEDPNRIAVYLAEYQGQVLAATTLVSVGDHTWYSYGASANTGREVRPSNAVQWQMIRDSLAADAAIYDLRGISDTLDPEDPLFGLIQFKLGTGGYAQEYLGEWDYPLRPLLAKLFEFYMARR